MPAARLVLLKAVLLINIIIIIIIIGTSKVCINFFGQKVKGVLRDRTSKSNGRTAEPCSSGSVGAVRQKFRRNRVRLDFCGNV